MDQSACKLTLVYPIGVENRIVDLMLESKPPLGGFTTWAAEGHGHDFGEATIGERVRGRVGRGVLVAVMARHRAEALLREIEQKAALPHVAYWLEPVFSFGRMAPAPQHTNPTEAAPAQT
ncbi:MAG: DUF3240 family protein [Hyphomicrobiaceae bacterium]|nr:DUF3240 family protein [Hyphomicrobiaceae bacterium]